jgi:5-methyltetrahydropteroyltriglutamate--homocysteine methyltransferase
MGRHTMYLDRSLEEFASLAARHIEVLNHALRNVPAERARMHVCRGNYEGPHRHDVPMARILPIVLKAKPRGLLFETANPRHAYEWSVFKDASIPDNKILIPGLLATTTNYIEHPQLVAERIERFANIVGRERVMAATDCGFGTFAGFGPVEPDIAYPKLWVAGRGSAARLPPALELSLQCRGGAA